LLKFYQIPSRIGHTAVAAESLVARDLKYDKKRTLFPYFNYPKSTNSYLKTLIRSQSKILADSASRPLNLINKFVPQLFTRPTADEYSHFYKNSLLSKSEYRLPEKDLTRGDSILVQQGLDANTPWITLCVRDGAYTRELSKLENDDPGTILRNSPIEIFVDAAYALAEKGLLVFRMGRAVDRPLPASHPNIIDYPYTNWSSDFMDIYLMARSKLCVSTSLGIDSVASLFRVPIAAINISQMSYQANWICELPKLFTERETGRKLRFSEIIERGVHSASSTEDFPEDLELVNRSSDEVMFACLEAIALVENRKLASSVNDVIFNGHYEKIRRKINQPRIDGLTHRLASCALSTQPDYLD
jgi:putative glycosyltransferase (TIGR04372 family)